MERRRFRLDALMVVATIMSSLAATAAVVIAVYQYGVARDQLVAADRNRNIQTMTEQVRVICQMLAEIGVPYDTMHRPGVVPPVMPTKPEEIEAYTRLMMDDLSTAEKEGRLFYDVDKVKQRQISEEFAKSYKQHYSDLMSSAQTVRLWIADSDSDTLRRISNYGFDVLDPQFMLPDELLKQSQDDSFNDKVWSVRFDSFQLASLYCSVLEPLIIDWAKGRDVKFPMFSPIPTVTRQTAERQVRENGRIERVKVEEIDPISLRGQ